MMKLIAAQKHSRALQAAIGYIPESLGNVGVLSSPLLVGRSDSVSFTALLLRSVLRLLVCDGTCAIKTHYCTTALKALLAALEMLYTEMKALYAVKILAGGREACA